MGLNKNDNSRILNSLVSELKRPLTLIARQAELEELQGKGQNISSIQKISENTLKLIDSYLLVAQSEYGQQSLPVKSFAIGSVLVSVAEEIRPAAKKANINLDLNVADALVIANQEGLRAAMRCLSEMVLSHTSSGNGDRIYINAKKSKGEVEVSVLSSSMKVKNSDLQKVSRELGKSHMALSSASDDSGVRLAIASLLSEALGTKLRAIRSKQAGGIGFNLSLSSQLHLGI